VKEILGRLFPRKPAPLRGAPAVRRQKTYSARTGYVYQYYYDGYRPSPDGREYVFTVSSDRRGSFPVAVLVPSAAVEAWRHKHGRELNAAEQYAAVKMSLFRTFDERTDLGPGQAEVRLDAEAVEAALAELEIE